MIRENIKGGCAGVKTREKCKKNARESQTEMQNKNKKSMAVVVTISRNQKPSQTLNWP